MMNTWPWKFTWGLVLALAAGAGAAPHLAPDSVTGAPGQTVSVPLRLTGTVPSLAGFNATIYLPSGVSLSNVVRGALLPSPGFTLLAQPLADPAANAATLLGYSATQTISSTGVLCTLLLAISSDLGPGDYPVVLDAPDRSPIVRGSHALSSADGASSSAHTVANGMLAVRIPGLPGDSNGNGIPDDWELLFFGTITNVNDHTDFDRDGLSDYREFLSGTDPRDPFSCVAIVPPMAQDPAGGGVLLRWHSISGAAYRIERAQALIAPHLFSRVGLDQAPTPPVNIYTDHPPLGTNSWFYRLIRKAE